MQTCKFVDTCEIVKCGKIHSKKWVEMKAKERGKEVCEKRGRCEKMGECGKYHPISDKVGSKMRREREEEDKGRMKITIMMVYKMDVKNLEMITMIMKLERKIREMEVGCGWIDSMTTMEDIRRMIREMDKLSKKKEELRLLKRRQGEVQKEVRSMRERLIRMDMREMTDRYEIK